MILATLIPYVAMMPPTKIQFNLTFDSGKNCPCHLKNFKMGAMTTILDLFKEKIRPGILSECQPFWI